jgi:hypothetical protein
MYIIDSMVDTVPSGQPTDRATLHGIPARKRRLKPKPISGKSALAGKGNRCSLKGSSIGGWRPGSRQLWPSDV